MRSGLYAVNYDVKSANSQEFYNFFKNIEKNSLFVEPCGTGYDIIITGYDKYIS